MTPLWGMLYADDAGVVSQSPEQLRSMMGMIVVVYAVFGLTVSEAKTEIMCLREKGMPESTGFTSLLLFSLFFFGVNQVLCCIQDVLIQLLHLTGFEQLPVHSRAYTVSFIATNTSLCSHVRLYHQLHQ